ncbi:D-alanyl-D-alanine carboxypeptidase family protein [Laedolimicola sp.]|uniref:D-alanyl-D-alanine carboxypeptidase family protein n=1 Tax=Laedolimicola sp. TaxID=2981663 RepID=UPI003F814AAD
MKFSHKFRFFTGFVALSLVGSLCFSPVSAEAAKKASKKSAKQIAAEKAAAEQLEAERQAAYNKAIDSNAIDGWPQGPQIYAESAIVMEASSGAILYNKDMDMKNYPASITKIMTALLTLENCSLDETVTYSYNATHTIDAGSSSIYTTEDEQLTVEQSLYALMLESANECANGLAEHVAGSIDAFTEMMNQKAAELGCTNTHFANANGLHNDNHYTSAHDMALITKAAIQNEDFLRISGTAKYQMQPTNKRDEITYMTNHHYMIAPYKGVTKYLDDSVIAGKTGNTSVAKGTLVTVAERNGMTLIVVTMRTQSTGEKGVPLFTDTALLLDYASENFTRFNVSENETNFSVAGSGTSYIGSAIFGQSKPLIQIDTNAGIVLPNGASFTDASPELTFQDENTDSDVIASLSYTYNEEPVGTADISLTKDNLQEFTFDKETDSDETADTDGTEKPIQQTHFIKINVRMILIVAGILLLLFLLYRLLRHLMKTFRFSIHLPKLHRRRARSRGRRTFFTGSKTGAKNKHSENRYHRTPKDRGGWDDLDL